VTCGKVLVCIGRINESQALAWRRSIEFWRTPRAPRTLCAVSGQTGATESRRSLDVHVKLSQLQLRRPPRKWGELARLTYGRVAVDPVLVDAVGNEPAKGTRWDRFC